MGIVIQFPAEASRQARLDRAFEKIASGMQQTNDALARIKARERSRDLGDELEAMLPPQALERARKR